jgi:DnaJ-domain-containing protein 1
VAAAARAAATDPGPLSQAPDPYRTLQVEPNADLDVIRAAYRRLARLYHPDRNPRPEAASRMRDINAAYRLLSDPARRAAYDARRYLPRVQVHTVQAVRPRARPVVTTAPSAQPTALQRRVDRIVAVVGVLLLVAIGFYGVSVIPYAEQQFQAERQGQSDRYRPPPRLAAGPGNGGGHDVGTAVPERLRSDDALKTFPGTVLVAPTTLEPFASLAVSRLDATGRGIARYAIYYGDRTSGGATIAGLLSRASFDVGAPRIADCRADAEYCVGPGAGQPASVVAPGLELFRGSHLVDDYPAFITHRVCCNGVFWSVSWYEPAANMTYTIDLSHSVAAQFGNANAEGDFSAARAVAALAPQLVRLH